MGTKRERYKRCINMHWNIQNIQSLKDVDRESQYYH